MRHPDARLIVAAVNALPGLLDALDAAEAEVERLRAGITALAGGWVHNGHPDTEGEPECPGCWAADLRALLDGAK